MKINVIGCGNIFTTFHYPVLKKMNHEFKNIIDPNIDNVKNFIKQENLKGTKLSKSLGEIEIEKNDIFLISNPSALHLETLKTLMSNEVHIFCEKPIFTNDSEINDSFKTSVLKYNKVIQVGYYRRFSNSIQFLKHAIELKQYGHVNFVKMNGGWPAGTSLPKSIITKSLSGGGITMDYGSHFIDLCMLLFKDLKVLSYRDDSEGGIEVNSSIKLITQEDINIKIDLSWTSFMGNYVQVFFDRATVTLGFNNPNSIHILKLNGQVQNIDFKKNINSRIENFETTSSPCSSQWQEFFNQVNGKDEKISSRQNAIKVSEIINDCYGIRTQLNNNFGK
ncbi:MAG: Gfo/Idh/MocA family oxidoreductase [Bacteroidetes bacterium]|nr:Gfo/Idh/MocA family oxidoreductase [Bacteroidota bacterium]